MLLIGICQWHYNRFRVVGLASFGSQAAMTRTASSQLVPEVLMWNLPRICFPTAGNTVSLSLPEWAVSRCPSAYAPAAADGARFYLDILCTMGDYAKTITRLGEETDMRKTTVLLFLAAVMFLGGALGLAALGLDVELKAGGGMAMGTTDDANKSGEVRWALDAGVALDLFVLEMGRVAFGVSAGAGYANLHFHGVWDNYPAQPFAPPATTTQTSDSEYNYVLFPVALVGRITMGRERALTLRGGGFAGYFLTGTTAVKYATEDLVASWVNDDEVSLDDTNTEQWMYGLSLYAGLDLLSKGRLSIVPSLQFDFGLTDTTVDMEIAPGVIYPPASKDTFWALTAHVGIRYSLLQ